MPKKKDKSGGGGSGSCEHLLEDAAFHLMVG